MHKYKDDAVFVIDREDYKIVTRLIVNIVVFFVDLLVLYLSFFWP